MSFFINFLEGIAIGTGAILPGISSGVFCVIFGIYEKLLDSILNFFNDIKKNIKFLFPILTGLMIGVLFVSKILNYLLNNFPIQTKSFFIGLIIGSTPFLFKKINEKQKFRFSYLFYTFITFLLGIFLVYLENHLPINSNYNYNFLYLVFSGFIMSIGVIVPGVSSTILLMLLGSYYIYLSSLASLFFPILIPIGFGLIFGCLVFMKLIKSLLAKFYVPTFYSIIGFTLGSIFVLLPDTNSTFEFFLSSCCILLGFFVFIFFKKD